MNYTEMLRNRLFIATKYIKKVKSVKFPFMCYFCHKWSPINCLSGFISHNIHYVCKNVNSTFI